MLTVPYLELNSLFGIIFDTETKTYRGGLSLAALGAQITHNLDIRQHSRPALKALAYGDDPLRNRVTSRRLEKFTERTITDPDALAKELEHVRAQGYAIDDEEISRGLTCIGAPIFDSSGAVIAALSLTAPSYNYEGGIPPQIIETIKAHAQQASLA